MVPCSANRTSLPLSPNNKNMLFLATLFLPLLALVPASLQAPAEYPYGTIDAPLAGTAVQPGANFSFSYNPHADYALSSFAIHVWLLTGTAVDDPWGLSEKTGHYFGRFDYANYPAVPYPTNPPPSQLTMPDFSKAPGGFAAGAEASNLPVKFVVVEEWGIGQGVVGNRISVTSVGLVYNATTQN
ncbi:hypothetical protein PHLGIDRAFT_108593 [Phlebiopsis gigantea 11061_1 CR5-6]|uniref:Uncharacterized protein n=1 Tax=Phlebiopsis gigantea (strain 11061_1 CR5-6) TaxID=745531 RepID=A0A0C3NJR3_PHLG1|nr:hypothetical protein PHLGIDRAFT_108593 [Phlebiopsis gigantea 11061_1 CR5-6]